MRFAREKRREQRRTAHERLFIQIVECSDRDLIGTTLSCYTLDISSEGLRVQANQFIPEGCHLDLWIDNNSRSGKFFLTSDVRWVRSLDEGYEFGIRLHEGVTTDFDEWRDFVNA